MPKISVLVPIYNVEQYLYECLESLINQTLIDIEIICINDGSTDNSLNIIKEYAAKDSRLKLINKNNTGYGHSMNMGLDLATGEYIGIVESDDFASPEMFERLYETAIFSDTEVVKSNYIAYKSQESQKENTFVENLKDCEYNCIFTPIDKENIFFVTASIWSGIYKRSFLSKHSIRFNETPGASYQDTSFAFKVWSLAQSVYLIKDAFLYYRSDNIGSSVFTANKVFCICDEYAEIDRFLKEAKIENNKFVLIAFALKFIAYKGTYNFLLSAYQYAFLLKMAEEFRKDELADVISSEYLTHNEKEEVKNIIHNTDKYFKETARDFSDYRLSTKFDYLVLNNDFYMDGFINGIKKYKYAVIFGAGVIGSKVGVKLYKELGNIYCFAVTNAEGNAKSLLGIPVIPINNLDKIASECIIIIATKEREQYEIVKYLKTLNFQNIVTIDAKILKSI